MKWFSKLNLKRFALLLVAPLILALSTPLVPTAAAEIPVLSGGSGTESDPYIISTPADLLALTTYFSENCTDKLFASSFQSAYYKLANDIDMSDVIIGNHLD